jgi:hypothetical protein
MHVLPLEILSAFMHFEKNDTIFFVIKYVQRQRALTGNQPMLVKMWRRVAGRLEFLGLI